MEYKIFGSRMSRSNFLIPRVVCPLAITVWAVITGSLLIAYLSTAACANDTVAREPLPKSWQADAELTDVFFVNENLGWAVGESGTILRTRDGGNTWNTQTNSNTFRKDTVRIEQKFRNLQNGQTTNSTGITNRQQTASPITCRLNSVHFIDANQGWAVGGFKLPYINRTQAVIVHTRDGGISWHPISDLAIPKLRKIEASTPRRAIAYGDSGNVFTGGIFETGDGGRSWSAIWQQTDVSWLDADRAKNHFVTINDVGNLGRYDNGQYEDAVLLGNRATKKVNFRCVKMVDDNIGVAVGNRGSLFKTENAGLSWQRLPTDATHPQLSRFDWQTAVVSDQKVIVAGFPGSTIATLDLKTNQLSIAKTPIRTKLNRLFFLNGNTGWAVGDFGVVLKTTDGGTTWKRLRGNTRGLAMLVVAPQANQVPVELLARHAFESNRNCGVLVLQDTNTAFEAARQASSRLGSCYHELILPSSGTAETLDPETVVAKLVRDIRTLKPAVVVSQAPQSYSQDINDPYQQISLAVKLAASSDAYPDDFALGLTVHRVSRFVVQDPIGPIRFKPERMLIQSGQQLQDQVAFSRSLLGEPTIDLLPDHYRISQSATGSTTKTVTDLLAGLPSHLVPSRLGKSLQRSNLADIRFANRSAKMLKDFADFKINTPQDLTVWRQQLQQFLNSMEVDVHNGGNWTIRLIEQYHAKGQSELAMQAAELMISRFPNSPYTIAVTTWLAKQYTSVEFGKLAFDQQVAWNILQADGSLSQPVQNKKRFSTGPQTSINAGVKTLTWQPLQPSVKNKTYQALAKTEDPEIELTSADEAGPDATPTLPSRRPEFYLQRLQRSTRLLSSVGQRDPDFAAGPYCQWLEIQLARQLNEINPNTINSLPNRYQKLIDGRGPLRRSIAEKVNHELTLLDSDIEASPQLAPPTISNCIEIADRPHLDGRLSEPCWQSAQAIPVLIATTSNHQSADQPRAQVQFCRDADHLYIAIACQKLPDHTYKPASRIRVRDAQVSNADHVSIQLDLDRDYDTEFRFSVDHQGKARELCDDFQSWNPNWFVSNSETESLWMVEAAIPLAAISPIKIRSGDQWHVRSSRHTLSSRTGSLKKESARTQSIFLQRPLPRLENILAF